MTRIQETLQAGRQLLHSIFMDKFTSRTQRCALVLPSKKKMVYDDMGWSISSEAGGGINYVQPGCRGSECRQQRTQRHTQVKAIVGGGCGGG